MRREAVPDDAGLRIERAGPVTRALGAGAGPDDNCILWSGLDEASADAVIAAERARAQGAGRALEWKVYAHDRPADLAQRLVRHGFAPDEPETVMVFDLARPLPPSPAARVRRVLDETGLEAVRQIKEAVWGAAADSLIDSLRRSLADTPELLSVYIVEDETGSPASAAWLRKPPGCAFASLWGGATLPSRRGRGFYRALVTTRLAEARAADYAFATVDARETSRPILERLGFAPLTAVRGYLWQPQRAIEAT